MSRLWKRILLASAAVFLLLFTVLVVHIIIVTKPGEGHHAALQLGRIDFPDSLSAEQSTEAYKAIKSIQGITIAKFNASKTSLVYSFPTGTRTCSDVFREFADQVDFASSPYIAPDLAQATGCPMMDKSSLTYRFSTFIQNTFH